MGVVTGGKVLLDFKSLYFPINFSREYYSPPLEKNFRRQCFKTLYFVKYIFLIRYLKYETKFDMTNCAHSRLTKYTNISMK